MDAPKSALTSATVQIAATFFGGPCGFSVLLANRSALKSPSFQIQVCKQPFVQVSMANTEFSVCALKSTCIKICL
jgi:hypothetical protein